MILHEEFLCKAENKLNNLLNFSRTPVFHVASILLKEKIGDENIPP
jgi:hypothetical protein